MNFGFSAKVNVRFGEEALTVLDGIKNKSVFILTTPPLVNNGSLDRIKEHLKDNKISFTDNIEPNPSCDNITAAVNLAKEKNAEVIIALGGGSVMDTGKCVAAFLENGGTPEEYMGGKLLKIAPLPLFCIPTTSGTGSEVTNVAVISDKKKGIKRPFVSPYMLPLYALVVPSLTLSVPKRITAETGWDAFCHAIEAYWNIESNPVSDAIAKDAIKLILNNIVKVYDDGSDIKARENMSLGSLMAGIAFAETRTTALHGLSFRLTSHYNLSHGRACVLSLLPFMKEVIRKNAQKMNELASSAGYNNADEMVIDVRKKLIYTEMAITLKEAGVPADRIEELADEGLKNKIMFLTPIEITKEKVIKMLESISE